MEQDIQNPKKALNRSWSADFSCSFHMVCHKMVLPSYNNKLSQCFLRKLPNLEAKFSSNHYRLVSMILILIQDAVVNNLN